jgi:glycosyltransferase involved in cell wall biosynthesis
MNNLKKPYISLVVPAYNEEDHIREVIEKIDSSIQILGVNYEVIIIDDGSVDGTCAEASGLASMNNHVKVFRYLRNMGKGYAIRKGFFESSGEFIVFIDSDSDIDPLQIMRYIKALEENDLVIASKRHPESHVKIPLLRRFLSFGFNVLVRLFTGLKVSDTQAGLKVVRKKRLEKVFLALTVKRFAFDVELLSVANLCGLKVLEMPINLQNKQPFFNLTEIFNMFVDLLGITYRVKTNKYNLNF